MRSIRTIFTIVVLALALTVAACSSGQTSSPAPTTSMRPSVASAAQLESISGDLVLRGYYPLSMSVDSGVNPAIVTTLWLSTNGGALETLVEVRSTDGVHSISLRFPNIGGPAPFVEYRCPTGTGIHVDLDAQLNRFYGKTPDQLKHESCQPVAGA